MFCDICHVREAKIIYTEIINGNRKEQHLCEVCAREQTVAIRDKLGEIPIGNILSGILQNYAKGIAAKSANEPVCMHCGMTASELVKSGRLGCAECYSTFSMILDKNLRTLQGADGHHGKEPANAKHIVIAEPVNTAKSAAQIMQEATDEIARRNALPEEDADMHGEAGNETGSKTGTTAETKTAAKTAGKTAGKNVAKTGNKTGTKTDTKTAAGARAITKSGEKTAAAAAQSIAELRSKMAEAVAAEDYTEAARLRDLIHNLEGGIDE